VWFPPEFEFREVERYAIQGRNVSLPCLVVASNPPVEKFTFFNRDNIVVFNHDHFVVTQELDRQMSVLRIDFVEEEDFGRYRCEVYNGKLRASQTVLLKRTRPPRQPKVLISRITNTSVTWRVSEERENGELPILSYSIVYGPSRSAAGKQAGQKNAPRSITPGNATTTPRPSEEVRILRQRSTDGLYHIPGLKPRVEYEFLFRAKSEAGMGDPTMVTTVISPDGVAMVKSAACASNAILSVLLLALMLLFIRP